VKLIRPLQDMIFETKKRDSESDVLLTLADTGFYELFLEYKKECDVRAVDHISSTTFYLCKPWNIQTTQKVEACVCVYHREMVLYMKALQAARKQVHHADVNEAHHGPLLDEAEGPLCLYSSSCKCECGACSRKVSYLCDFMDTVLCPRKKDSRMYSLACVLGTCLLCGWDKIQGTCPIDRTAMAKSGEQEVTVNVRLLESQSIIKAGQVKQLKVETQLTLPFSKFMKDIEEKVRTFKLHDFIARWQAGQYHEQLRNLKKGHEVWIADYIENFKSFTKIELQQDYYNKTQISIFIVMVIRWRRDGENFDEAQVA